MPKIKISLFSVVWFAVLLLSDTPYLLPMLFAVLLHELGHLLCAVILKIRIRRFNMSMLGARFETEGKLSYTDEFLLAMAGPLFGSLGFLLTVRYALKYSSVPFCADFLLPFSMISLELTLFNLIPLSTLDGGRMLESLLCKTFSLDVANRILKITSFLTLFCLWLFSVYMLLKITSGLSMFVFCSILFTKCFILNTQNEDFKSF